MNVTEIKGIFHCDCGFSWAKGESGSHNCADGLREKLQKLAAENVALKLKGRELLNEASKVYQKYNATIDFYSGDFMDGQTLHEFQFVLDAETSATDAFLAGIKADAIDEAAVELDRVDTVASTRVIGFKLREFSQQLREGTK